MIYYISDLHLSDKNIIKNCNRLFYNIEEMNEEIIKRWNSVISSNDTVYLLGDVAFPRNLKEIEQIIFLVKQLNGIKILIKGNHDCRLLRNQEFRGLFQDIQQYVEIIDGGRRVVLMHYPLEDWNNKFHGSFHLHGHIHNNQLSARENRYNVSCDVIDFTPKMLDELICLSHDKKIESKDNEILITGDTHGDGLFARFKQAKELGCKTLIVCGDFGYIWSDLVRNKCNLSIIEKIGIKILFLDGNHENFDVLEQYPISKMYSGDVQVISENIIHLLRGQVYNISNKKIFIMGGANSTDKLLRVEGRSWWEQELPNQDERDNAVFNLQKVCNKVDIVLTHTAPSSVLESMGAEYRIDEYTEFLELINSKVEFKHWYFGHMHKDKRIDDKHTCVYYGFHNLK